MKLRNRETGGLANMLDEQDFIRVYTDAGWADYYSLASLNAEWEDYKPKDPLIKDEKIRRAVRAWAEAQGLTEVYCASNGYEIYGGDDDLVIQFEGEPFSFADRNSTYTIDELCGEEEE